MSFDNPQQDNAEEEARSDEKPSRLKSLVANVQAEILARDAWQSANREMMKTFARLGPKYGWTFAAFVTEYYPLRNKFVYLGDRKTEWDLFLDRERKRIKSSPRTNADVKAMSDLEAKEHRQRQLREAKQRQRAKKRAKKEAEKEAATAHLLSDDQLALIARAERNAA